MMIGVPYRTVYISPPGALIQARFLKNQEGANTERYVFGKLSARCFQRRPFRDRHYFNCGDIEHGRSAQGGCDVHRRIFLYQGM